MTLLNLSDVLPNERRTHGLLNTRRYKLPFFHIDTLYDKWNEWSLLSTTYHRSTWAEIDLISAERFNPANNSSSRL